MNPRSGPRQGKKGAEPAYNGIVLRLLRSLIVPTVLLASTSPLHAASLDGAPPAGAAAVPEGGRSLRLGGGIVSPESLPVTPWLLAGLRLRARGIALEAEAGYWSRSEIAFGLSASVRDVQLGTSLTWSPLRLGRARALLGAGPAAHIVTSSAGPLAGERAAATRVRLGIQAWAALEITIGARSALFVAGREGWILRREREDERELRVYGGVRVGF